MINVNSTTTSGWVSAALATSNKPTGLAAGELLFARHVVTLGYMTEAAPAGWTQLGYKEDPTFTYISFVYFKIADAADAAASNFSFTTAASVNQHLSIHRVTGFDSDTSLIQIEAATVVNSETPSVSSGLTPAEANSLVMQMWLANTATTIGSYSISNANPSWNETYDAAGPATVAMAYAVRPETDALGTIAAAGGTFTTDWALQTIIIREGGGTPEVTHSVFFTYESGIQYINFRHRNASFEADTIKVAWSPQVGNWNHVAVSMSGSTVAFYVNGIQQGSTTDITKDRSHNANADFIVGATEINEATFDGKIDDVRVWKYQKNSAAILASMEVELTGTESSLVSYYKFTQNLLDTVTANNNDLTAVNDPDYTNRVPFGASTIYFPNHILKRHSDGRMYVADVVGNQGTLHYVKTTKTTVEGDTNNGSTYNAVQVGYGLYPTAMESYGEQMVIAFFEGNDTGVRGKTSKLAFWDTTSDNVNSIIWVEFPDSIITALKNVNGILYITTTNPRSIGFRVSRLIGGYTIQEVAYTELGQAPLAGGVDGTANRLIFGSATSVPRQAACVLSLGLQKGALGPGLFNIASFEDGVMASAAILPNMSYATGEATSGFGFYTPMVGWSGGDYNGEVSVISPSGSYDTQIWWSQMYRIGRPGVIKKIRIPLAQKLINGMAIVPKIYADDGETVYTLKEANYTNDPNVYVIKRNDTDASGEILNFQHSFFLVLEWNGTVLCTVSLPIEIEYEVINDA